MPRFDIQRLPSLARDFTDGATISQLSAKYGLRNRGLLNYLTRARRRGLISNVNFARLLIDRTRYDFPRDSEARLEAVLSCMNTELKQAILLVLEAQPRTYTEIRYRLANLTNAPLPTPQAFSAYCTDTLLANGFLLHERLGKGLRLANHYFGLSQEGLKYGRPIAAFSLKYAVDHNISLYELLGQAQTVGDSASPFNRARIIELVSEGYHQIVDLTGRLGLVIEDVRQHLQKLQKLGLLAYDSLNFESKGVKSYSWVRGRTPAEAQTVSELKALTKNVAQWLYANKRGERNEIARGLGYPHLPSISRVLVGLAGQGLLESPFGSTDKSRIVLLRTSKLLGDYTGAVRNALENKSDLRDMKGLLKEFIRDERLLIRYLDAGIELYYSVSTHINTKTPEERESELLQFIEKFEKRERKGARPVDAVRATGWTHGTVTRCLRSLFKKGCLAKEKEGPAARYRLRLEHA